MSAKMLRGLLLRTELSLCVRGGASAWRGKSVEDWIARGLGVSYAQRAVGAARELLIAVAGVKAPDNAARP